MQFLRSSRMWLGLAALLVGAAGFYWFIFETESHLDPQIGRVAEDDSAGSGFAERKTLEARTTRTGNETNSLLVLPPELHRKENHLLEEAFRRLIDGTVTSAERPLLMEQVYAARREMTEAQLREFLEWTNRTARDLNTPAELRAKALSNLIGLTVLMEERAFLTRDEAKREAPFLMEVAFNGEADVRLREFALHGLGVLQIEEASPALRSFLQEPANVDVTGLGRGALRAFHRLEGSESFDLTREVLATTESETVFMTAAELLSEQGNFAAVSALLENRHVFPASDYPSFALVKLEEPITEALMDPDHPQLREAITASLFLWKEEQQERLRPVLLELVQTAPLEERKLVAERLILDASQAALPLEKERLQDLLQEIQSDPDLTDYADRIRLRLTARIVPAVSQ